MKTSERVFFPLQKTEKMLHKRGGVVIFHVVHTNSVIYHGVASFWRIIFRSLWILGDREVEIQSGFCDANYKLFVIYNTSHY